MNTEITVHPKLQHYDGEAPITETPKQERGSARMISKLTKTTAFAILIASSSGLLPNADAQTSSAESIVRRAYHMAEGDVNMTWKGSKICSPTTA